MTLSVTRASCYLAAFFVFGLSSVAFAMSGVDLKDLAAAFERVQVRGGPNQGPPGDAADASSFAGYVTGVRDIADAMVISRTPVQIACVPQGVTTGQLAAMVAKYVREHPEEWSRTGDELVVRTFRQTFPCPTK
jgi:Rap1a immunity proteins